MPCLMELEVHSEPGSVHLIVADSFKEMNDELIKRGFVAVSANSLSVGGGHVSIEKDCFWVGKDIDGNEISVMPPTMVHVSQLKPLPAAREAGECVK